MHTHSSTHSSARNIKAAMVAFMIDRGGCTREDLLKKFTPEQIDKYGETAAREADRQANRRAA